MIQWIVAAQVGRELRYLTWGNERLSSELKSLSQSLGAMDVTVGNQIASKDSTFRTNVASADPIL